MYRGPHASKLPSEIALDSGIPGNYSGIDGQSETTTAQGIDPRDQSGPNIAWD